MISYYCNSRQVRLDLRDTLLMIQKHLEVRECGLLHTLVYVIKELHDLGYVLNEQFCTCLVLRVLRSQGSL